MSKAYLMDSVPNNYLTRWWKRGSNSRASDPESYTVPLDHTRFKRYRYDIWKSNVMSLRVPMALSWWTRMWGKPTFDARRVRANLIDDIARRY